MKTEKNKQKLYQETIPADFVFQTSRVFRDFVERKESGEETLIPYPLDVVGELDDNWLYIVANMGEYAHECVKEAVEKHGEKFVSLVFKAFFYITRESPHAPYILTQKHLSALNNLGFSVVYNGEIFNGQRNFCFSSIMAYGSDVYSERRYLFYHDFNTPILVEREVLKKEMEKMIERYKQYINEKTNEFFSVRF